MNRREPCVAIDGPAGAGKSTVSRRVAEQLGYVLLDTGALYRSVALATSRAGYAFDDEERVGALARNIAERGAIRFEVGEGSGVRILLDGEDVSALIRTQEIASGASQVSALPAVRAALLDVQRESARAGAVVLEGRDIGTVVLPDAEAKFFLTASVDVRADRRYKELLAKGETPDPEEIRREVRERDHRDTMRPIAPLKPAPDAVLLDSTDLGIDAVVAAIVDRVQQVRARLQADVPGGAPPAKKT